MSADTTSPGKSMTSQTTIKAFTDAAADAVAREIARLRTAAASERELREAEHRARMAELETRLLSAADIERRLAERLAALKDGDPGQDGVDGADGKDGAPGSDGRDGVDGKDGVDGADGKDGKDGTNGRDGLDVADIDVTQNGTLLELAFTVGDTRSFFEIELPQGPAGPDGKDGERGERGADGRLPSVTAWAAGVQYEGAVRSHEGSTWQAACDTANEPPHEDWVCIAGRGLDGKDGASLNPRRLWAPADEYKRLDVVALNGGSFVALKDDPGECPGSGWMLLTQQGKRGERGEKGERGDRGERGLAAEPVVAMTIDEQGMLTLTNGDGTKVNCDLYPVLVKLVR